MAAIMGRESAYTGQIITWDEMVASSLDLYPKDIDLEKKMNIEGYGTVEFKLPEYISIPGKPQGNQKR